MHLSSTQTDKDKIVVSAVCIWQNEIPREEESARRDARRNRTLLAYSRRSRAFTYTRRRARRSTPRDMTQFQGAAAVYGVSWIFN